MRARTEGLADTRCDGSRGLEERGDAASFVSAARCRESEAGSVASDAADSELLSRTHKKTHNTGCSRKSPTAKLAAGLDLHSVGTAGFEFNGPHAGPLFYRHLRAPTDRIGSYWLPWTGKHYGKHLCDYLVKESRGRFVVCTVHDSVVPPRDESGRPQHCCDHLGGGLHLVFTVFITL